MAETPLKIGFALEYSLGHTTHAQNLKRVLEHDPTVSPVYVDLPYENTPGWWAKLPGLRSNWSARASLGARLGLRPYASTLDAALFHTQVTSLFSTDFMRRVPSVVSLDATPLQYDALGAFYNHAPSGRGRLEEWKKSLNEKAFASATHLVSWSEWAKGSLVSDYGVSADKVTVIPPGIDTVRWNFGPRRVKAPNEAVNLLFVGGDFGRKGGTTLLMALSELTRLTTRPIHCDIVTKNAITIGDGINQKNVSCIVHNNVVPNSETLLALFAEADVFVFPTQGDCLPLAVLEALSAGLPVITTDVGALAEAVRDNKTGLIILPIISALTAAILDLVENDERRAAMGKNARADALRRFDAETNYHALVDVVKAAAKTKR